MAVVTLKGTKFHTLGDLPAVGTQLPDFKLTGTDLADRTLSDFAGSKVILNIFPSIDTGTCQASVRKFNAEASGLDVVVLCISRDLPFAQTRFCGAENLKRVITLSSLRDDSFGLSYGVSFTEGPLEGLFSRAVIVADEQGVITYAQQVSETTDEPDYASVLAAL